MLNFIELKRVVEELKKLENGIIENIWFFPDHLTILIYKDGKNILKFFPKKAIFLSSYRIRKEKPDRITTLLRRELKREKIEEINQIGNERVVEFILKSGERIIFEIKPPGRFFFKEYCLRAGKIRKEKLEFEETGGIMENFDAFYKRLINSDKKDLVRALAIDFKLMGKHAEEIIFRAKVDKNIKPPRINEETAKKLFSEYLGIINEIKESKNSWVTEKFVSLARITWLPSKKFGFWEGFDNFFYPEEEKKAEKEKERIMARIREMEAQEEKFRKIADYLMNHPEILEKALQDGKRIIKILGYSIKIDPKKGFLRNVGEYYEKAKKLRKKIERAKEILKNIEKKIKEEKRKIIVIKKEPKEWYEKFRWFVSSEGLLVVAGKDAITNEILIRKYLEKKDIVLHAEIRGSPFTVIKRGGERTCERTLLEAAQFTLSYSKAWEYGLKVPVYWVYPNQLKKTPPPGHYLPKGSFIIEGKKNYIENVDFGIGLKLEANRIVYGPILSRKDWDILIFPGELKKGEAAKKILEFYRARGVRVDYNMIIEILPGRCNLIYKTE